MSFIKLTTTIAALVLAVKLAESGLSFSAVMLLVSVAFSHPVITFPFLSLCYDRYAQWCKKRRINGAALLSMLIGALSVLTITLASIEPAHALFFSSAESYIKNNVKLSGIDNSAFTSMISFVFVILRLSFLIYIGVAVVQIIQKGREQEDWISLARTPAIVAGSVFIGDAMAGMVVGDGSASGGGTTGG